MARRTFLRSPRICTIVTLDPLQQAVESLTDERDPDWDTLARTANEATRRRLRALHDISLIARTQTGATRTMVPPFRWGALEVVECVAFGAHGDVYRARDPHLDRDVALKLLHSAPDDDGSQDAGLMEGRLLARVRHPTVVTVYGADRIDGRAGIWMEFVRGRTLQQEVHARGPLPVNEAIRTVIEVCRALEAIHGAGLIHRDVKAHNVMREDSGRVVLMDFGAGFDPSGPDARMEGTPAYLAPELWTGRRAHIASDIYAVGVLLFFLLSGRLPVGGRSLTELRQWHRTGNAVPLGALDRVPADVTAVIARALAARPEGRFQSAGALAAALERLLPHRRTWLFPAFAAGTAVCAVGLALALHTNPSVPHLFRAQHVTVDPGLEIDPSLAPDGRRIAYAAGIPGHMRVFIKRLPDGEPQRVSTDTRGDERRPRWRPDGNGLLFTNGSEIIVSAGPMDPPVRIAHQTPFRSAEWTPDGQRIVAVADNAVWTVPSDGGTLVRVRSVDPGAYALAISPDASRIAWSVGNPDFANGTTQFGNIASAAVYVGSMTGSDAEAITDRNYLNTGPVWLDDQVVMFVSNRDGARDVYAKRVDSPASPPLRMTTGLDVLTAALLRPRKLLSYVTFQRKANAAYAAMRADGRVLTSADLVPLTAANQTIEEMAPSADGQWLYYCSDVSGYSNLFRLKLPSGPVQRLTSADEDQFINDVSPDGREIAFHILRSGVREVEVMPAEGGQPQWVARGLAAVWSPDGRALLFSDGPFDYGVQPTGIHRVVRRAPNGRWGTPEPMHDHGCGGGQWLADAARWLDVCDQEIRVMDLTGTTLRTVYAPSGAADPVPVFARVTEDDTVYFKSYDPAGGLASVWRVPIKGGRPALVLRLDDPTRPSNRSSFNVSHGRLYLAIDTYESDIWVASLDAVGVR
jgi:Tol biopolymer transport system component/predicted Ser/Thr protein kinase